MIYFLVEGYSYTHSKKTYFLRLSIVALLSQVPFDLAFTQKGILDFVAFNIFKMVLLHLLSCASAHPGHIADHIHLLKSWRSCRAGRQRSPSKRRPGRHCLSGRSLELMTRRRAIGRWTDARGAHGCVSRAVAARRVLSKQSRPGHCRPSSLRRRSRCPRGSRPSSHRRTGQRCSPKNSRLPDWSATSRHRNTSASPGLRETDLRRAAPVPRW